MSNPDVPVNVLHQFMKHRQDFVSRDFKGDSFGREMGEPGKAESEKQFGRTWLKCCEV